MLYIFLTTFALQKTKIPKYFSTFGTVVSKHALISVTLGDPRQFFVPFLEKRFKRNMVFSVGK